MQPRTLFLVPNLLGGEDPALVLPASVGPAIAHVRHFLVEEEKSARKLLKKLLPEIDLRSLSLSALNEHTKPQEVGALLQPLRDGNDMAIISEAGCPVIADPGAPAIREAHKMGARVRPLVGPSSIVLALMASGYSGQRFVFEGYLPVESSARRNALERIDAGLQKDRVPHIFIETPYRNKALLADIMATCRGSTMLTVASSLTTAEERIMTLPIDGWKKAPSAIDKVPAVFILY